MARFVLKYEKGEGARWLSHLDVLRAFERALRRSDLPLVYTSGFNPRPKLWFAAPIGVGTTGEAELAAFDLEAPVDAEDVGDRLAAVMPDGLAVRGAWRVQERGAPFKADLVNKMRLVLAIPEGADAAGMEDALKRFLASSEIVVKRDRDGASKMLNIRPRVLRLELERCAEGEATVLADLAVSGDFGVRPAEVVGALAEFLPGLELVSVHRIDIMERR